MFDRSTCLLLLSLAGCVRFSPPPEPAGPNLLLLTVDTLRPDYLSLAGYDRPTSPTIDGLVEKGTWFSRTVTPVPRTTPALTSLLTGLHPHHHGVRRLTDTRRDEAATIAQVAKAAGYQTVAVVSNHIVKPERGLNAGFDVYNMRGDGRVAARTTSHALARLRVTEPERPVLLWVHYIDPHVPYRPPEAVARAFDPGYTGRYALHFGGRPGAVGNQAYPKDLGKRRAVFDNPLPEEVNAHVRRLYAADVRQTDDAIATLLEGVREARGDDWRVVFTSDHGESLGENDYFYDHGDFVYEGAARVPLALVDLKSPRERRQDVDAWTSLVDVAPTVAEWMGWTWPREMDGQSLMPAVRGEPVEDRPVFVESGFNYLEGAVPRRVSRDIAGRFRSVTIGDDKLVFTPGHAEPWELYDLADDPWETTNLWEDHGAEAQHLVDTLRAWMAEDDEHAPAPPALTDDDLEALRALGYVE